MTKKFWKFVTEDGNSPGIFSTIRYTPGETVEVKDADPDKNIQCSSGIHCIDFSEEQYDDHNIIIGKKVAILEVDEEDIIYYEKNGKCRVRKAKVLEVKEPELWMKTGNGNILWTYSYAKRVLPKKDPDLMEVFINKGDPYYAHYYAKNVLKGHDGRLMEVIIDKKDAKYALFYARGVLKGHDERLMQIIIDSEDIRYAYYYAKDVLKGHDERLMQVIIDSGDGHYAYYYAAFILKKHEAKLMQVVIDMKNSECAYNYARYVLKGHDEKLMEIADNDPYYKKLYEKYVMCYKEQNND